MVSHLRKMGTLSAAPAKSATRPFTLSPLFPLFTTAVQNEKAEMGVETPQRDIALRVHFAKVELRRA
jgi:hypothetical protein